MSKVTNIPRNKYVKFLKKQGCKCNRKKGSHSHYTRSDLKRPLTINLIDPVPKFIIKQHLKYLKIKQKEFLDIIDDL